MQNFAEMCKILQKCSKTQQNFAKNVQQIVCKSKKIPQLEKVSTDGIPRVPRFFHLCWTLPFINNMFKNIWRKKTFVYLSYCDKGWIINISESEHFLLVSPQQKEKKLMIKKPRQFQYDWFTSSLKFNTFANAAPPAPPALPTQTAVAPSLIYTCPSTLPYLTSYHAPPVTFDPPTPPSPAPGTPCYSCYSSYSY